MSPFLLKENICIKVYDVESKNLIAVYSNYRKAALKLGLTYKKIQTCALSKSRLYAPFIKKLVAIRTGKCTEEMQDLIEKTLKNKL